jgi:hypothetical protein
MTRVMGDLHVKTIHKIMWENMVEPHRTQMTI